jgi:hypothetical protein
MLHDCFTPIYACFVYTSFHFYIFSGTNLLIRWHSSRSLFSVVFVFQKSYKGNILGIRWNKSRSVYFTETKFRGPRPTQHQGPFLHNGECLVGQGPSPPYSRKILKGIYYAKFANITQILNRIGVLTPLRSPLGSTTWSHTQNLKYTSIMQEKY